MMHKVKAAICSNCDANYVQSESNFCDNCGQENHTHKLPLSYFVKDLVETFTNFDTKTIATLRDLLLSPGLLTKNFNNNKRVRYVPPVRLYLVTSAIFFFLLTFAFQDDISQTGNHIRNDLMKDNGQGQVSFFTKTEFTGEQFNQLMTIENPTISQIDSFCYSNSINTDFFNTRMLKGMVDFRNGKLNIETIEQKMMENFSYALFLCMPLFSLLLYFFQSRKKYFFTEHLIFTLHFHTYIFIIFGIGISIMKWIFLFNKIWFHIIAMLVLAKSIHVVYQQKWFLTIVKTLTISALYLFLIFTSVILSLVGAFL